MSDFFAQLRAKFAQSQAAAKDAADRGSAGGSEKERSSDSTWRRKDRYSGGSRGGGDRDEDEDEGDTCDSRDSSPEPRKRKSTDMPPPPPRPKQQQKQARYSQPHRPPVARNDVVRIGPAGGPIRGKVLYDQEREDENALDDLQIAAVKKWARVRPEKEWVPTPSYMARILALGPVENEEDCFGCCYMRFDTTAANYDRCLGLFALIKRCMSIAAHCLMCIAIEFYYEKYVRGPTLLEGAVQAGKKPLPPWKRGTISKHFRCHDPSFMFRRLNRLDQLNGMLNHLHDNNMYTQARHKNGEPMQDANGERLAKLDPDSADLFNTLSRLEGYLYGQNPKTVILAGSSEELTQDARSLISLEGKTFTTENGSLFSGVTPNSFQGGAGEGGTVGAVRRM